MSPEQLIDFYGTQSNAARALGVRQSLISAWKNKMGRIPWSEQHLIQELTNGKLRVTPDGWRLDLKRLRV